MEKLRQFIQEESQTLIRTLGVYLMRADLNHDPHELLNEVVVEALRCEERFRAWLRVFLIE